MDLFAGHEPVCTINIHWTRMLFVVNCTIKHNFEWVTTLQKLSSVNIKSVKCSTLLLDLSVLPDRPYNSTYVSPFVRLFVRSFVCFLVIRLFVFWSFVCSFVCSLVQSFSQNWLIRFFRFFA